MLGKLIKHEFKATARTFLPLLGAYLATIILLRLFNLITLNNDFIAFSILAGFIGFIFIVLLFGVLIFPIISSVTRFNKNLLGDEGYLMNTLPVSANKLVISKFIVSACWFIICALSLFASLLIMLVGDKGFEEFINALKEFFGQFIDQVTENPMLIISVIIVIITSAFASIFMFYSSICIGHLANSGRKIKGVLSFIGLSIIQQMIVFSVFQGLETPLNDANWSELKYAYFILWLFIIFNLIFGGIFYFITQRVLTKRLNIQ